MFTRITKFGVEILSENALEDNRREKPKFLTTQDENTSGDTMERKAG